jgi:hypothetical protein
VNTRDPRDPRDRDTGYKETRTTYTTTPEPRSERSWNWLRWAIPVAIAALVLPLLFRGHREPEQRPPTALEQPQQQGQPMAQQGQPMAQQGQQVGSTFLEGGATLSDADRQKLAEMAKTAKEQGTGVTVIASRENSEPVRQELIAQGVPESSIEIRPPAVPDSNQVELRLAEK